MKPTSNECDQVKTSEYNKRGPAQVGTMSKAQKKAKV